MTGGHIQEKTDLAENDCPLGVKSGKARTEQLLSGLPSIADIQRCRRQVRSVPLADICSAAKKLTRSPRRQWQAMLHARRGRAPWQQLGVRGSETHSFASHL